MVSKAQGDKNQDLCPQRNFDTDDFCTLLASNTSRTLQGASKYHQTFHCYLIPIEEFDVITLFHYIPKSGQYILCNNWGFRIVDM